VVEKTRRELRGSGGDEEPKRKKKSGSRSRAKKKGVEGETQSHVQVFGTQLIC
jgi:hypothetical protein